MNLGIVLKFCSATNNCALKRRMRVNDYTWEQTPRKETRMTNYFAKTLVLAGLAITMAWGTAWAQDDQKPADEKARKTLPGNAATAEHSGDAHGHPHEKPKVPDTIDGIFKEVSARLILLDKTLADKKLGDVHGIAFEIRDLMLALPDKATDLAADKKTALTDGLKKIKQEAGLLDKYGDAGDATQTKTVLAKFKTDIESVRKLVGAKEVTEAGAPEQEIKLAKNAVCPISGEAVGSMEKDAHVDYKGYRVGLCCTGCASKFKQNADASLAKALGDKAVK
jgi:hypothetical protein